MGQFGAAVLAMDVSAMDVSAMKCEMFSFGMSPKCKSSHCRCEACTIGARFGLALVPGHSSHAVFNGIHDACIVLLCFGLSSSKILADGEVHWPLTLKMTTKTTSFVSNTVLTVLNLCTHDILRNVDNHILR